MSMVPLMFRDWWDDIDRPSRILDQHFGLGLRRDDLLSSFPSTMTSLAPLLRSSGYIRPWHNFGRQNSGTSNITVDKDKFQVILDVQQFSPSEITVKTVDHSVVVEARHEEKQDEHGFVSRQFVRRYLLPNDSEVTDVMSTLSSDGVLTITAPSKKKPVSSGERVVTIVHTGAPAVKETTACTTVDQEPTIETPN